MKLWPTTLLSSFLVGGLLLFTAGITYTGGSPGAKSGSPGDNNQSCTQCHSGTPVGVEDWISTDIPASGYVPGSTYTITVSAAHDSQKFGFEATAERIGNQKTGTFIITNSNETKLVNNDFAVTHTSGGTAGSNSRSWSFDWVAPSEGSGPVTFYAAVNATNSNNSTSGDVVYVTQYGVNEVNTSLPELQESAMNVYPNPASDHLNIDISFAGLQDVKEVLYNPLGKIVKHRTLNPLDVASQSFRIMTDDLTPGTYFLQVGNDVDKHIQKIIINR